MYINQIDEFLDKTLDIFYTFLINENLFNKINKNINFVKFQPLILETIKKSKGLILVSRCKQVTPKLYKSLLNLDSPRNCSGAAY